ncbi:MAG: glycosyltransferase family 4 protein [bacterium]|nr:glycosyltransferase family 4 protein [bacterium]
MSRGSVLHVLTQRPGRTGSGVTLDALVRQAARADWDQRVVVGIPAGETPGVGGLAQERIFPLVFETPQLEFPVPGMSDVMPYPSTVFSRMTPGQLEAYRAAWRRHLTSVLDRFRPDVIHAHHVWLVGALLKEIAPGIPVVNHCHATGLRQMELCPHLEDEVRAGCARNDRFVVLHGGHAELLRDVLGVSGERVSVIGAGYRDDLFHTRGRASEREARLIYIGKYAAAKGLPWLLDAFELLRDRRPGLELHVAGSGAGDEADALARRMRDTAGVVLHGAVDQPSLADLLRRCSVCALPSFYEGLPLVLVEALACGCRLVATELPGVNEELAPHVGSALEAVPLPRRTDVDRPVADDLPRFTENLHAALERALERDRRDPSFEPPQEALSRFSWSAVFERVERVWLELAGD